MAQSWQIHCGQMVMFTVHFVVLSGIIKNMLPILSLTLRSRQYNCHSLQIILSAGCSYRNFAAMLAAAEYVFQPLTVADFSSLHSRERWS